MRIGNALRWYAQGQKLAFRSLLAGTLPGAGLRSAVGAFARPITAPSRYPEYEVVRTLLHANLDLQDPSTWLLDIGSPKLFSLLLAAETRATVVGTDIWQPAIDEAEALRGGLPRDAAERSILSAMDAREPVPAALRPPHGQFAGAFSMSVVEHIEPDPGGEVIALTQVAESVRPGGTIVVSVPVDRTARSEYLRNEMYGRSSSDERGQFFQRVYDTAKLEGVVTALAAEMTLEECVIIDWPQHKLLELQPKYPTAIGFAGASFPLLAPRFEVHASSPTIPAITGPGDAIMRFRRA